MGLPSQTLIFCPKMLWVILLVLSGTGYLWTLLTIMAIFVAAARVFLDRRPLVREDFAADVIIALHLP